MTRTQRKIYQQETEKELQEDYEEKSKEAKEIQESWGAISSLEDYKTKYSQLPEDIKPFFQSPQQLESSQESFRAEQKQIVLDRIEGLKGRIQDVERQKQNRQEWWDSKSSKYKSKNSDSQDRAMDRYDERIEDYHDEINLLQQNIGKIDQGFMAHDVMSDARNELADWKEKQLQTQKIQKQPEITIPENESPAQTYVRLLRTQPEKAPEYIKSLEIQTETKKRYEETTRKIKKKELEDKGVKVTEVPFSEKAYLLAEEKLTRDGMSSKEIPTPLKSILIYPETSIDSRTPYQEVQFFEEKKATLPLSVALEKYGRKEPTYKSGGSISKTEDEKFIKLARLGTKIEEVQQARKNLYVDEGIENIERFAGSLVGENKFFKSAIAGSIGFPFYGLQFASYIPESLLKTSFVSSALFIEDTKAEAKAQLKEGLDASKEAVKKMFTTPEGLGFIASIGILSGIKSFGTKTLLDVEVKTGYKSGVKTTLIRAKTTGEPYIIDYTIPSGKRSFTFAKGKRLNLNQFDSDFIYDPNIPNFQTIYAEPITKINPNLIKRLNYEISPKSDIAIYKTPPYINLPVEELVLPPLPPDIPLDYMGKAPEQQIYSPKIIRIVKEKGTIEGSVSIKSKFTRVNKVFDVVVGETPGSIEVTGFKSGLLTSNIKGLGYATKSLYLVKSRFGNEVTEKLIKATGAETGTSNIEGFDIFTEITAKGKKLEPIYTPKPEITKSLMTRTQQMIKGLEPEPIQPSTERPLSVDYEEVVNPIAVTTFKAKTIGRAKYTKGDISGLELSQVDAETRRFKFIEDSYEFTKGPNKVIYPLPKGTLTKTNDLTIPIKDLAIKEPEFIFPKIDKTKPTSFEQIPEIRRSVEIIKEITKIDYSGMGELNDYSLITGISIGADITKAGKEWMKPIKKKDIVKVPKELRDIIFESTKLEGCLLYTSPSPRD